MAESTDLEYNKLKQTLQKYIPFLETMIESAKSNDKASQWQKMEQLHNIITDNSRKWKIETLKRSEDVLKKLCMKVNYKLPPSPTTAMDTPASPDDDTPASPSPTREIESAAPVVIPTEKITGDNSTSKIDTIPKIDVYSSAGESLTRHQNERKTVFDRLGSKLPDMSKPPLSIDELRTLQDEEKLQNISLHELNALKAEITKKISEEEKLFTKEINTTVRNNSTPMKKIDKSKQSSSSSKSSSPSSSKTNMPSTSSNSIKQANSSHANKDVTSTKKMEPKAEKCSSNKSTKVIKESDSIFGNVLSSIDEKILENKKERRSSTSSREDKKESSSSKSHKSSSSSKKDDKKKDDHGRSNSNEHRKDDQRKDGHHHHKSSKSIHKSEKASHSKSDKKDSHKKDEHLKDHRKDNKREDKEHKKCYKERKDDDKTVKCEKVEKDVISTVYSDIDKVPDVEPPSSPDVVEMDDSDCIIQEEKTDLKPKTPRFPAQFCRLADKFNPKPRSQTQETEESIDKKIEENMRRAPAQFLDASDVPTPLPGPSDPVPEPTISNIALLNNVITQLKIQTIQTTRTQLVAPHHQNLAPTQQLFNQQNTFNANNLNNQLQDVSSPSVMHHNQIMGGQSIHAMQMLNQNALQYPNQVSNFNNDVFSNISNHNSMGIQTPMLTNQIPLASPNQMLLSNQNPLTSPNQILYDNQQGFNQNRMMQQNFNPLQSPPQSLFDVSHNKPRDPRLHSMRSQHKPIENVIFQPPENNVENSLWGRSDRTKDIRGDPRLSRNEPSRNIREPRSYREFVEMKNRANEIGTDNTSAFLADGDNRNASRKPEPRGSRFDTKTNLFTRRVETQIPSHSREESFMSPLDSLYGGAGHSSTGKGYGNQVYKSKRDRDKNRFQSNKAIEFKNVSSSPRSSEEHWDNEINTPNYIHTGNTSNWNEDIISINYNRQTKPIVNEENWDDEIIPAEPNVTFQKPKFSRWDGKNPNRTNKRIVEQEENWDDEIIQLPTSSTTCDFELENTSPKIQKEKEIIPTVSKVEHDKNIDNDNSNNAKNDASANVNEEENGKNNNNKSGENSKDTEGNSEKKLIANFFENLLGSSNKNAQKAALLSIINTFSDKLQDKQIQRIAKIIEQDGDSDEDDENVKETTASEIEQNIESPPKNVKQVKKPARRIRKLSSSSSSTKDESVTNEILVEESNKPGNLTPSGQSKRTARKSELEKLHEDIKEMFISDGVLTANGKRMGRILANSEESEIKSSENTSKNVKEIIIEKKTKPAPKSKKKIESNVKSVQDVRVLLSKVPENVIVKKRTRRSTRLIESDNDDDDTSTVADSVASSDIQDDVELDNDVSQENTTKKIIKKKKRSSGWASGVIKPKKRKKKVNLDSSIGSDNESESSKTKEKDSINIPDINYYSDSVPSAKFNCALCPFVGGFISNHYKSEHPSSEVLSSRLSQKVAAKAIKNSKQSLKKYESIANLKSNNEVRHKCIFCGFCSTPQKVATNFYDHLTVHTGEFRHLCNLCEFSSATKSGIRTHFSNKHPGVPRNYKIEKCDIDTIIFGYLCGECNFVQLKKEALEKHVKDHHDKTCKIHKINMSTSELPITEIEIQEEVPKKRKLSSTTSPEEPELKTGKKLKKSPKVNNVNKIADEVVDETPNAKANKGRAAKQVATQKMKAQLETEEDRPTKAKKQKSDDAELDVDNMSLSSRIVVEKHINVDELPDDDLPLFNKLSSDTDDKADIKPVDMKVFTCDTNMEEEDQKLQKERLKMMEDVNKSIVTRSSLSFINQLSSRLKDESILSTSSSEEIDIMDNKISDKNAEIPVEDIELNSDKESINNFSTITAANMDVTQKSNQYMEKLLQKLQGVVNSTIFEVEGDKYDESDKQSGTPALATVTGLNLKPADNSIVVDGGLIRIVKTDDDVNFCCQVTSCIYFSNDKDLFQDHCKEAHTFDAYSLTCGVCLKSIETFRTPALLTLLKHLLDEHCSKLFDSPSKAPLIRTRRFSGDILSFKEELDEKEDPLSIEKVENKLSSPVIENDLLPSTSNDENPFDFVIENVVSLADTASIENEPPPLTIIPTNKPKPVSPKNITEIELTVQEAKKIRKTSHAVASFMSKITDLYKCPLYYCTISTNDRNEFENHFKIHQENPEVLIPCVYCDIKTPMTDVAAHIYLRHAHCGFGCRYCLYRAINRDYVLIHQSLKHPEKEASVIFLPTASDPKKHQFIEKLPAKNACIPFRCFECSKEFLFENDFRHHLTSSHEISQVLQCGYQNCREMKLAGEIANHWNEFHSVCEFQCVYCKYSTSDVTTVPIHFATIHQNVDPEVIQRKGQTGSGTDTQVLNNLPSVTNFPKINKNIAINLKHNRPIIRKSSPKGQIPLLKTTVNQSNSGNKNNQQPTQQHDSNKISFIKSNTINIIQDEEVKNEQVDLTKNYVESTDNSTPINAHVDSIEQKENDCEIQEPELATSASEKPINKGKTIVGLLGAQLFKCICKMSFPNGFLLKQHLWQSENCKQVNNKLLPYECVHCGKLKKTPSYLIDHLMYHGILRFTCSLCTEKFPTLFQTKSHLKYKHNVNKTCVLPVKPEKNNLEMDEFVVKPELLMPKENKETAVPDLKVEPEDLVFSPDDIDKIPIRSIFSSFLKCATCSYTTKVRTNFIRHLQFHSEEKAVPETAPVNPVPCLDKNEKMFDKMTNLAFNSLTGTRMGGSKVEKANEDGSQIPDFIPSHQRFVCCAENCNYLCLEESNLRHHLMALHEDETNFTCTHCKKPIIPPDADAIIKHLKLHGLHLYKCGYCNFVHNLKHKVERHVTDNHLDKPMQIVTVRSYDTEPMSEDMYQQSNVGQNTTAILTKPVRPWRCCMCKSRSNTLEEIKNHVLVKHNIDSQYKCTLCQYKTNDEDTFDAHFKDHHPGQEMDIIHVFRKVEEIPKTDIQEIFDTTPLWQRDKPRVRHIRGILFDESASSSSASTSANKSPKKQKSVAMDSGKLESVIDSVALGVQESNEKSVEENNRFSKSIIDSFEDLIDGKSCKNYEDEEFSLVELMKMYGILGSPFNRQLQCPICNKFKTRQILQFVYHILQENKEQRYICKKCTFRCITFKNILKHISIHDGTFEDFEEIDVNPKLLTWIQMLICHQSRESVKKYKLVKPPEGGDVICNFCNKRFRTPITLWEHQLEHWIKKPYGCSYCTYETFHITNLQAHTEHEHKNQPVNVIINCSLIKDVLNEETLSLSKETSEIASTSTSIAPQQTDDINILLNEDSNSIDNVDLLSLKCEEVMENDGAEETFICLRCPFMIDTQYEMQIHLESCPNGSKSFRTITRKNMKYEGCHYCRTIFTEIGSRQHYLDNHLDGDYKPLKYQCVACSDLFSLTSSLVNHCRKLHNIENVNLEDCYLKKPNFVQKSQPQQKKRTLRLFKCTCCSYTNISNSTNNIRHHMKSHYMSFSCGHCSQRFRGQGDCNKHLQKVHANLPNKYVIDEAENKKLNDVVIDIIKAATIYTNDQSIHQNTARKSTGGLQKSRPILKEFSFYGCQPENVNLSLIKATYLENNQPVVVAADILSQKFDLFPRVVVENCDLKVDDFEL